MPQKEVKKLRNKSRVCSQDTIITNKIGIRMFQIIQDVFFQNSIPTILFSDIRSLGM